MTIIHTVIRCTHAFISHDGQIGERMIFSRVIKQRMLTIVTPFVLLTYEKESLYTLSLSLDTWFS